MERSHLLGLGGRELPQQHWRVWQGRADRAEPGGLGLRYLVQTADGLLLALLG